MEWQSYTVRRRKNETTSNTSTNTKKATASEGSFWFATSTARNI